MNRAEAPILQQIHTRFAYEIVSPSLELSDNNVSEIRMKSFRNGYQITTDPGAFDSLKLKVKVDGGIFGGNRPKGIKIVRNLQEAAIYNATLVDKEKGAVVFNGSISEPTTDKALLLPGDQGFALFEDLHAQIQKIKDPLSNALELVYPIEPVTFALKDEDYGYSVHLDETSMTHERESTYKITGINGEKVKVVLDASNFIRDGEEDMEDSVSEYYAGSYHAGIATIEDGEHFDAQGELNNVAIVKFNLLRGNIEDLYLEP